MIARIVLTLIVATALGFAIGCSKSSTTQASFGSSSDSSSSPFKSSSKSSSGDDEEEGEEKDKETAFQRDVRNYTVEFARNADDSDIASFHRGIASIAEGYGITNWEQAEGTFVAIGRGLGESKLDDADAKQLAVTLSNESYDDLTLIQTGLESRRTQ
jgi:hypothetical protein